MFGWPTRGHEAEVLEGHIKQLFTEDLETNEALQDLRQRSEVNASMVYVPKRKASSRAHLSELAALPHFAHEMSSPLPSARFHTVSPWQLSFPAPQLMTRKQ